MKRLLTSFVILSILVVPVSIMASTSTTTSTSTAQIQERVNQLVQLLQQLIVLLTDRLKTLQSNANQNIYPNNGGFDFTNGAGGGPLGTNGQQGNNGWLSYPQAPYSGLAPTGGSPLSGSPLASGPSSPLTSQSLGTNDTITGGTAVGSFGSQQPVQPFVGNVDSSCDTENLQIKEKLLPSYRTKARTQAIDTIVLHDTDPDTSYPADLNKRLDAIYNGWVDSASAHYLIEQGGPLTVYRYVPDDKVASHVYGTNPTPVPPDTSPRQNINSFSIGIELDYTKWWDPNGLDHPNPEQYDALNRLIKCLKRKYPTIKQVILHCQASDYGPTRGKEDPRHFEWSKVGDSLSGLRYRDPSGGNCKP